MNRGREIVGSGTHLDRQHRFANQFARALAGNPRAQHPFRFGVDDEFGHTFGVIECQRAARCAPRKASDLDRDPLLLRLGFGQTAPGNLGIGEHHRRDNIFVQCFMVTGDRVDRQPGLARRLVRQQHATRHISNGVQRGVVRLLLLVDVDEFKGINDTYGHDAGDAFLVETSNRLQSAVRSTDQVARLGGDEFSILLIGRHDEEWLNKICDRIVGSFSAPVMFNDGSIRATVSVGVASFPKDGDTQEILYKSADIALYEAKRLGRNNWQKYRPEIQQDL